MWKRRPGQISTAVVVSQDVAQKQDVKNDDWSKTDQRQQGLFMIAARYERPRTCWRSLVDACQGSLFIERIHTKRRNILNTF